MATLVEVDTADEMQQPATLDAQLATGPEHNAAMDAAAAAAASAAQQSSDGLSASERPLPAPSATAGPLPPSSTPLQQPATGPQDLGSPGVRQRKPRAIVGEQEPLIAQGGGTLQVQYLPQVCQDVQCTHRGSCNMPRHAIPTAHHQRIVITRC